MKKWLCLFLSLLLLAASACSPGNAAGQAGDRP